MLHRSDRRDRHTETEISKHSHTFWYSLRLVCIKNQVPQTKEIPLYIIPLPDNPEKDILPHNPEF